MINHTGALLNHFRMQARRVLSGGGAPIPAPSTQPSGWPKPTPRHTNAPDHDEESQIVCNHPPFPLRDLLMHDYDAPSFPVKMTPCYIGFNRGIPSPSPRVYDASSKQGGRYPDPLHKVFPRRI